MIVLKTIDAHAGGEPLRLIVDGFPALRGKSMLDKRDWATEHADHIRRALMFEPRGHADMCGALLTEPVLPGSHAGLLFMHNEGYSALSGHAVIAVTTIALERGLLMPGPVSPGHDVDDAPIVYDTPAGTVRARATRAGKAGGAGRVERVAYANVPSFVLHPGLAVTVGGRHLRADVAYGGGFYAIVDSEAAGLGVNSAHAPALRRTGMEIARAIEATHTITHPLEPRLSGLDGIIFTSPPGGDGDIRSATVFANGALDRSPGGNSTSAIMAVLAAMGLLGEDGGGFVHESITGTGWSGRITGRTMVGDYEAILPTIEGSAWITGEHTFFVDEHDPMWKGFHL
jgi:proline racemase